MTSYLSGLVGDTAPGLALALIAFVAALPSYLLVSQSARGRARSAIAYLTGLAAGLAATIALAIALGSRVDPAAVGTAGLLASFFAPFAGIARGKWRGKRRPLTRRVMVEGIERRMRDPAMPSAPPRP